MYAGELLWPGEPLKNGGTDEPNNRLTEEVRVVFRPSPPSKFDTQYSILDIQYPVFNIPKCREIHPLQLE